MHARRPPRPHGRIVRSASSSRLAAAAVVVGAAIRFEQFGWRRSLWVDEALIANNIITRSFGGLTHPLSGEQAAPIGWLWMQRGLVLGLGDNEYALRILPLAAGIAALFLVHRVARRIAGPWPAVVATWILALSPTAIRYSVEVKQYSTDLAIGAGLMVLALRAVDHRVTDGRQDRHAVAQWGIAGLVAVWISHPAVLIMAATAVVLGADSMRRSGRRERRVAALACVPWVLGFAADWWVSLRVLGRDPFLHSYWAAGFPPHPFGLPSYVAWVVRATSHVAADPGAIHFAGVAAIVAVIGLALVVAQKPLEGLLLVAPLVVALGAASIGSYPLDGRLVLWLLPLLAIGLAGVTINRPVGALVVAVLVLQPVGSALSVAAHPTTWQDSRPLFQAVARARQPHDEVWIHQSDLAVGDFYGRLTGVVPTNAVQDSGVPGGCGGANLNLAGVAGPSRVWFIYGYHQSNAAPDEEQAVVAKLRSVAHLVATIRRPQTAAYLFDFAQTPDTGPANGDLACVTVTRL